MKEKLIEKVFSLKNEYKNNQKYKVLNIFGAKIKHKTGEYKPQEDLYCNDYISDLEGGFLRMRVTHKCNCRCEWCAQKFWPQEVQEATQDPKWLYEYCRPLYGRVNTILTGGGEITFAKEGYNFVKFLADNYPQTNILTESNGILYDEKWQNLAIENLNMQHFSLNASNPEDYTNSVWKEGGAAIYNKALGNIKSLAYKWSEAGMPYFAPSISMVVTSKNAHDVYNFAKLGLELGLKGCGYYFEQAEGSLNGTSFKNPQIMEPALKTLMELERVLAKKFFITFRLWLPLNSTQKLQAEVDSTPIEELNEKHKEILELAKGRDIYKEWELRNEARKLKGKKLLTIEEDLQPSLHNECRILPNGKQKKMCFAPYKSFDVMADGTIILCGWVDWEINLKDYIVNDKVDWANLLNHPVYQDMRKKVLQDDYSRCMDCCPLHPKNPHLNDFLDINLGLNKEQ